MVKDDQQTTGGDREEGEAMTETPIHVISLGAGVQSSTMALMAAKGEITPMPVAAVFADTQGEPEEVYRWLDYLEPQLPFPVFRVTKGSLEERSTTVRFSEKNQKWTLTSIPAFCKNPDGIQGLIPRQCTRDFKIDPTTKEVNRLRRLRDNVRAVLWMGISIDEVLRAKDHRNAPRIINRFPLIDARMSRRDCLSWMQTNGFPEPPRSACYYCPFRSNEEWLRMKQDAPADFSKACVFEGKLQLAATQTSTLRGVPFLHRSLVPLAEVDFNPKKGDPNQLDLFTNECEGMCGV
jgi:3'-phosphoadenosine 5'-phosphosulfate sulfotransferase (PAPS reductase)/FAD synthetase